MKIFFVSDSLELATTRRKKLIELFNKEKFQIKFFGLTFPLQILANLNSLNDLYLVSSNLKANVLHLFLPFVNGAFIFNGLGRYRRNKKFRTLILFLLIFSSKLKLFIFQSYADYRYFKRFSNLQNLFQINGTGGQRFVYERNPKFETATCVTRPNKIDLCYKCILEFIDKFRFNVVLVGVADVGKKLTHHNSDKIFCVGRVNNNETLTFSKYFIQPTGYGEGISQALCDAVVSEVDIYIHKDEYIRTGFYRYKISIKKFGRWILMNGVSKAVNVEDCHLSKLYYELIIQHLNNVDLRKQNGI